MMVDRDSFIRRTVAMPKAEARKLMRASMMRTAATMTGEVPAKATEAERAAVAADPRARMAANMRRLIEQGTGRSIEAGAN